MANDTISGSREQGFIKNTQQLVDQQGNVNSDVLYMADCGGIKIQLKKKSISYEVYRIDTPEKDKEGTKGQCRYNFHRVDIDFLNGNLSPEIIPSDKTSATTRHYASAAWNGQPADRYNIITYKEVWPGIDIQFKLVESDGKTIIKYDIIVYGKGKADDIGLLVTGADKLLVNEAGELVIQTSLGNITEQIPFCSSKGKQVGASFCINNSIVSYEFQDGISSDLIIDPLVRVWGTYYGGADNDILRSTTIDGSGKIIVAGETRSTAQIATSGSYQGSCAGSMDGFVAKFSKDGSLIWASYFGGPSNDCFNDLGCDQSGNIYLTGTTESNTGIAFNGFQNMYSGWDDAMMVKFDSSGNRQWSSYYGGPENDCGQSISVDQGGNIVVSGWTLSDTNISSPGCYQALRAGQTDGFLVKINPAGNRIWGTYFGGAEEDYICSVDHDISGNIMFAGETKSSSGIATAGSHQSALGSLLISDGFIAKFNSSGSMMWATYYGGTNDDYASSIAVNSNSDIYVAGSTRSNSGIASAGAHQETIGDSGFSDGFLAHFTSSGSLIWGTYYGGTGNDAITDIIQSGDSSVLITGETRSNSGISTAGTYQDNIGSPGLNDAFLARFSEAGNLQWGTYYGGTGDDHGYGLFADQHGNIIITGETGSPDQISTPLCHQYSQGSSPDGFIGRFCLPFEAEVNLPQVTLCENEALLFTINLTENFGSPIFQWFHNGTAIPAANISQLYIYPVTVGDSGTYYCQVFSGCSLVSSDTALVIINPLPLADAGADTFICAGGSVQLTASGGSFYQWHPGQSLSDSTIFNPLASPDTTQIYTVEVISDFGCTSSADVAVVINEWPEIISQPTETEITMCEGEQFALSFSAIGTAISYQWFHDSDSLSGENDSTLIIDPVNTGSSGYYWFIVLNICGEVTSDTFLLQVDTVVIIVLQPESEQICEGSQALFEVQTEVTAYSPNFQWFHAGNEIPGPHSGILTIQNATLNEGGEYYCRINNSCDTIYSDSVFLIIHENPVADAGPDQQICPGDSAMLTGNGGTLYNWGPSSSLDFPDISDPIAIPEFTTTYSLTVTDSFGCTATDIVTVQIYSLPAITIESGIEDNIIFSGQSIVFTAMPDGYPQYDFYVNKQLMQSGPNNIFITSSLSNGDIVMVIATAEEGCTSASDEELIEIHIIPNGFSPDGDGINELFMAGSEIIIIDRWGLELYHGTDGWNGKYKGSEVSPGTYFYIISISDSDNRPVSLLKGALLLFRN